MANVNRKPKILLHRSPLNGEVGKGNNSAIPIRAIYRVSGLGMDRAINYGTPVELINHRERGRCWRPGGREAVFRALCHPATTTNR